MIVDIHNHFLPRKFPPLPSGVDPAVWPAMVPGEGDTQTMTIGDRPFRAFDSRYWDVARRLAEMDAEGVDLHVLSPLPELLSYWIDGIAGAALCRAVNDAGSEMANEAPERLRFLTVLPLQDVDMALAELGRVANLPGVVGLFVGSHVNGVSIAAEAFDTVLAEAARLSLYVFVHGIRPAGSERLEGGPLVNAAIGIPHENAGAIASFMMRDVLGRNPDLKLVFSHGGGSIGAMLDRLALIWSEFPQMQAMLKQSPVEYARRFFYDTAVFGADYVGYLARCFGADRLLAGTDGPTEIGQKDLATFLSRAGLSGDELTAVAGGNAASLLKLENIARREAVSA